MTNGAIWRGGKDWNGRRLFSWARTAELTLGSYRLAMASNEQPLGESEKATGVEANNARYPRTADKTVALARPSKS